MDIDKAFEVIDENFEERLREFLVEAIENGDESLKKAAERVLDHVNDLTRSPADKRVAARLQNILAESFVATFQPERVPHIEAQKAKRKLIRFIKSKESEGRKAWPEVSAAVQKFKNAFPQFEKDLSGNLCLAYMADDRSWRVDFTEEGNDGYYDITATLS